MAGKQRWTAADRANNMIETQYNGVSQSLGVSSPGQEQIYFVAPGNQHPNPLKNYSERAMPR